MSKESIEKRARELFADQLRKEGQFEYAHHVAVGGDVDLDRAALNAILAAAMLVGLAQIAALRAVFLAARAAMRWGRKVVAA